MQRFESRRPNRPVFLTHSVAFTGGNVMGTNEEVSKAMPQVTELGKALTKRGPKGSHLHSLRLHGCQG
jgi:hypothetical protein